MAKILFCSPFIKRKVLCIIKWVNMQYFNREFHSSTTCWFNDTPCHTYGTYCSNNEKLTIIALYIFGSRMNMSNQITYLIKLLSLTSHVNFRFHQNNLIYKITKAPKSLSIFIFHIRFTLIYHKSVKDGLSLSDFPIMTSLTGCLRPAIGGMTSMLA